MLPAAAEQYGGYDPADYKHLVGTYYMHRRSFLTARNIVRGVVTISIDDEKRCLAFEEFNDYISDAGIHDQTLYNGQIHINRDRNLFSLHATNDGHHRLLMAQSPYQAKGANPNLPGWSRIVVRGVLLTHGVARGMWQPTVSAVVMESLPPNMGKNARAQCRTIKPDDPEFAAIGLEIAFAEEHASVMTPLMWVKLPALGGPVR